MDLDLNEEQAMIQSALGNLFAKEASGERVRAAEPLGFDPILWKLLSAQGTATMGVPHSQGGAGVSTLGMATAAIEFGKRLAPAPLIENVVATNLLARVGEAGQARLGDCVEHGQIASLALRPATGQIAPLAPAGAIADVMLVLHHDQLVAVHGHDRAPLVPNLGCSPIADVAVPVDAPVLAQSSTAMALHADAVDEWRVLTAAALVGLATTALELALVYVNERWAFDVPLASFQAIQHRLADVATAVDGARLLVYEAAWARQEHAPNAAQLASMSFLFASETAFRTAAESLHFHGGYGYTLEYDIQLYFRRAKAWPLALGASRIQYRHLASLLFSDAKALN
jgi:alkylation response protein AidB-like acyl-CoA dehydrogenase